MFNIYIPSKDRPQCLTAKLLKSNNILNFKIVVEPQDYEKYVDIWGNDKIIMLKENNKGLIYSRNNISGISISNNEKYHWLMDDDILDISVWKGIKDPNLCLNSMEDFVLRYKNVALAGPQNSAFAFSKTKPYSTNCQICQVILINNSTGIRWDNKWKDMNGKDFIRQDTNLAIQHLETKYWTTIQFNAFVITTKPCGTQLGGLGKYSNDRNIVINSTNALKRKYPHLPISLINKKGDLRTNTSSVWRLYKQKLINI